MAAKAIFSTQYASSSNLKPRGAIRKIIFEKIHKTLQPGVDNLFYSYLMKNYSNVDPILFSVLEPLIERFYFFSNNYQYAYGGLDYFRTVEQISEGNHIIMIVMLSLMHLLKDNKEDWDLIPSILHIKDKNGNNIWVKTNGSAYTKYTQEFYLIIKRHGAKKFIELAELLKDEKEIINFDPTLDISKMNVNIEEYYQKRTYSMGSSIKSCPQCKSYSYFSKMVQTRSADEGATLVMQCASCGFTK